MSECVDDVGFTFDPFAQMGCIDVMSIGVTFTHPHTLLSKRHTLKAISVSVITSRIKCKYIVSLCIIIKCSKWLKHTPSVLNVYRNRKR